MRNLCIVESGIRMDAVGGSDQFFDTDVLNVTKGMRNENGVDYSGV